MNFLGANFPVLGSNLPRAELAETPTPIENVDIIYANTTHTLSIKRDDLSSTVYGGNKVRKLEYLLSPPAGEITRRFATFGTVGSHHALATSLFAHQLGYDCTCFLAHQRKTSGIAQVLNMHILAGTEIVRYGGTYANRLRTLRKCLWGRNARVVPAGGSSWLGTVGFVNAGLELAQQISTGEIESPDRIYIACGTMGSVAGLALGLALCELPVEIHAVRVSHAAIANEQVLGRLVRKTAQMLHRIDPTFPCELENRCNVRLRHEFFGGGYAHSNEQVENAIKYAESELGLSLESTYTGKAMAALLQDLASGYSGFAMFWNTYNSVPLPALTELSGGAAGLSGEFSGYFS